MSAPPKDFQPDLYTEDADGNKTDAALHAEMLDHNPHADEAFQAECIRLAKEAGMDEETITRLYRNE